MGNYEQNTKIRNGNTELVSTESVLLPMWNCSRKLFIMQETSPSNLANAFVKAFGGEGLVKVLNSCQNAAHLVLGLQLKAQGAVSSVLPAGSSQGSQRSVGLLLLSLSPCTAGDGWAAGLELEAVLFSGIKQWEVLLGAQHLRAANACGVFPERVFVDVTSVNRTGRGCLADLEACLFFLC